jgi:hypothetical protein
MGIESGFPGFDEQPTLLLTGNKYIVTNGQQEQPNIATVGSDMVRVVPQNIENLLITNLSAAPLTIRINPHTRTKSDGTVVTFTNTISLLPTDPPFELRDRPIFNVEVEATDDSQAFRYNEW